MISIFHISTRKAACETNPQGVVGLEISRNDVSEVHGAHQLLDKIGPNTLLLVDADITAGGFLEHVREQKGHVLAALQADAWKDLPKQRRLADGSVLAWIPPSHG